MKNFNIKRLYYLIRNYMFLERQRFLIMGIVFFIVISLLSILNLTDCDEDFYNSYNTLFMIILFIGGVSETGRISRDLHDRIKGSCWIVLPSSKIEKCAGLLVVIMVIFPVILTISLFLASLFSEAVIRIFYYSCHSLFNPFSAEYMKSIAGYIISLSPFFLGAFYFKTNSTGKTFLSLLIFLILIGIILSLGVSIFLGEYFESLIAYISELGGMEEASNVIIDLMARLQPVGYVFKSISDTFFRYILAPLCWVIAYFSFKEMEI